MRARTTNSAGASRWSEPREHYSHQRPFDNGGLGPGYAWKQSHKSVTLLVPVGAAVTPVNICPDTTAENAGTVCACSPAMPTTTQL